MTRAMAWATACVFACNLFCGCTSSPPPVVVGHVANFTGPDKDVAEQAANGIKLALEDYAQKPGRPIVVKHADDKGSTETTEGQAVRLASINHAVALLGGEDATEAAGIDRAASFLLAPIAQPLKSTSGIVVVTGLTPAQRGKALAKYLSETVKPKDAALVFVEPGDDASAASATEAAFRAALPVDKQLARIERGDARSDAVKKWAEELDRDTLPIVFASPTALKALALGPLRDRPIAYAGPEIARLPLKERTAPIYLVTAFGGDKAAEFDKRYQAKFTTPAEPQAAIAYDDARLLFELIKNGPLSSTKLREEAKGPKEFAGLFGPMKLADGVVERPAFAGRLEKGSFEAAK